VTGFEYPNSGRLHDLCEEVMAELEADYAAGRPVPSCFQQVVGIIVQRGLQDSIFIDALDTRFGVELREAPVH
jgi:hypothetical protein